jgi:molybdopterin-guanine dinucleotide biosynthesis protein B
MSNYKYKAVALTGPSNSGKTTIIEKIAKALLLKYRVVIIKNDPKDKATFDTVGKDSHKFFTAGADTIVTSPTRTTYFSHYTKNLDELIKLAGEFDYLLVEGLKDLPLPRIAIFRNSIDESYYNYSNALATDNSVDPNQYKIPDNITLLDLNDTNMIISWIDKNAKVVPNG